MQEIREINRGGFGIVHEVIDDEGHRVARKSFAPLVAEAEHVRLKKRFAREVRIQSRIVHPNVMPIHESNLDADPPWFTMPLATESFEDKLVVDRSQGRVDTAAWQDVLAAVEELHRLGYVHRDLKPANILKVADRWMLSDFGLILPTSRDTTILTRAGSAYGSHYYAAPEQAQDFSSTPEQADLFALGCILHDATDANPQRVPFAQIRVGGPYGPILEKCTETEVAKRFPTVASLRAALFDLWRTSEFEPPNPSDAGVLERVLSVPQSADAWRSFLSVAERQNAGERDGLLRAVSAELLTQAKAVDEVLFGRLVGLICEWASSMGFAWAYCDVVGDRLLEAYRLGSVRVRCDVVLAAMELAVSHNRWHVMNHVGAMLGQAADNGLVDRLLIEMGLDERLERKLLTIEKVIYWPRARWHTRIAAVLSRQPAATGDGEMVPR